MKLFFDESGNSGADVYDPNQPVLAYGGAWLNDVDEQHFSTFLAGLRGRHGLQGTGELKGKTLVKSAPGRRALVEVLRELNVRKIPVSLVAVNKPFFSAGVLIDDCTDYAYNSAFDERWTWDTNLTVPLTQTIIDCADPTLLVEAWRARNGDDVAVLKNAYGALLASLSQHANQDLASVARKMALADLDELWGCSETTRQTGMGYSPNLSAFGAMLHGCEEQAEQLGCSNVEIVHDEQSEFRTAFAHWWGALRAAKPGHIAYPSGNEQRFPLKLLTSLAFVESDNETGVQLADMLASAMRVAVQERTTGQGTRANDFISALKDVCSARERMGIYPFFIGPPRWQVDMLAMLGFQPA